jgi:hypothetical protein
MLKKKDIVNGLFTRDDNNHLYTVFDNRLYSTKYHLICLTGQFLVESYESIMDLRYELNGGYTKIGTFAELDVASLIAEKAIPVEDTY